MMQTIFRAGIEADDDDDHGEDADDSDEVRMRMIVEVTS